VPARTRGQRATTGTAPTITDANLVLGRISGERLLAGEVRLHEELARRAIAGLLPHVPGVPDVEALADGVVRIAVARMVGAIKEISIAKGHDPRDFSLVAYGGAGPMHAALIAEELEIPRVVVPPAPGNFSAFGSLISDLRRDYVRTRLVGTRTGRIADVAETFAELAAEARADLGREGIPDDRLTTLRALGMRYQGQSWELIVRVPEPGDSMEALEEAFHQAHERRYGHRGPGAVEIVNFRLTGVGAIPRPARARWTVRGRLADARLGTRPVYFDRALWPVPVYERDRLPGGLPLDGPAVVEEMGSTTVVPGGWTGRIGEWGELTLERRVL
jgi:N-methylhydantoinase A